MSFASPAAAKDHASKQAHQRDPAGFIVRYSFEYDRCLAGVFGQFSTRILDTDLHRL